MNLFIFKTLNHSKKNLHILNNIDFGEKKILTDFFF
jgi:hypothetical protein